MALKIYTVAQERSFPGHGGGHEEWMICRTGSYGTGDFPPFFMTSEGAETYRSKQPSYPKTKIVELDLWTFLPNDWSRDK